MPAGLRISEDDVNKELKRRQAGFGRGKRMKLEKDKADILCGLKSGVTLASPIALLIKNADSGIEKLHKVVAPRPGHADLAGFLKYGMGDIRDVLERASARSTAATVGIGALCKVLLRQFRIQIFSSVLSIAGASSVSLMKLRIKEAIKNKDTVGGIFEVVAKGVPQD